MDNEALKNLQPGDLIRHRFGDEIYVVTGKYGNRVTAVRTVDVTNSREWMVVAAANHEIEKA